MLSLAFKPGHDGAAAAIQDGKLLFSIEAEKDSFKRFAHLLPGTMLASAEMIGAMPDIVALGGWYYQVDGYGVGYAGSKLEEARNGTFFGHPVCYYSSSHERSHIYGALGMSGDREPGPRTVLVWEGDLGKLYQIGPDFRVSAERAVMEEPGARYGLVYSIANPDVTDDVKAPAQDYAGKLMALAAFGDPESDRYPQVADVVDQLMDWGRLPAGAKGSFCDTALYNVGVEAQICKDVAAVVTRRIFEKFSQAAMEFAPRDSRLLISGGCGLNCDWNAMWRDLGYFNSVFVPPCPNDSGSALGTAVDAMFYATGDPFVEWNVYAGMEFIDDAEPGAAEWDLRQVEDHDLSDVLMAGEVVAWVQGRWEIGPRALGNRSLLAEPFKPSTRDKLNAMKQREGYRPIAPCVRVEDLPTVFGDNFEDPYMLYFRLVQDRSLHAITHVDGSARAQTVSSRSNPRLHQLLTAFSELTGVGALCNTSLNGSGLGFINRMSDLIMYADACGLNEIIVGDKWFRRRQRSGDPRA